ncbi:tetraacyldisaccharide 4'-kinase [Emticicia sp. C21]|uniref:tetraacyldisaccharide 4'-kinase n=1 Tax=Emticicia sp. C21 TaxID=2302915 RepID=UPI000E34B8FA|nr:tetraacyldisaccharide 4'-kinase [Emticicia sp. C21]RFS18489.1 tetraacyldisaccharide 4'-kinase [Emticicia sp. C21]
MFFILRIVLFPITILLTCVVYIRNWLYDNGILKSTQPDVFTINVGNLNLGGTGKTPHVEYLVNLLSNQYKTSILSRGYKRQTKGFVLADNTVNAKTIGDEPMQYYLKFKDKIKVIVCENRVQGVNQIQATFPDNELVILDDAFQHRKIAPHLNLLLCDYNRPFYKDYLVPVGKLRDIRRSANRAHVVIVTKCPEEVSAQIKEEMKTSISQYTFANTPVFFSRIHYNAIASYVGDKAFISENPATVVTAIAKPEVFQQYLQKKGYKIEKARDYPDHFAFSRKEIDALLDTQNPAQQIITTEKDMVKIKPLLIEQELEKFFYIPIDVIISDKNDFDKFILSNAARAISKSI